MRPQATSGVFERIVTHLNGGGNVFLDDNSVIRKWCNQTIGARLSAIQKIEFAQSCFAATKSQNEGRYFVECPPDPSKCLLPVPKAILGAPLWEHREQAAQIRRAPCIPDQRVDSEDLLQGAQCRTMGVVGAV